MTYTTATDVLKLRKEREAAAARIDAIFNIWCSEMMAIQITEVAKINLMRTVLEFQPGKE